MLLWAGCDPAVDSKDFQQELADINTQMEETLQQIEQLHEEGDVSRFSRNARLFLGSLDNQIEQYHLLMDRTNRKIDKETRDLIIRFKQKKVEVEFKLDLLENAGVFPRKTDTLSYGDTVITTPNASGSALGPDIEPLETDKTDVELREDPTLPHVRINEWKYAGIDLRDELINDLQEIQEEIEIFMERNL